MTESESVALPFGDSAISIQFVHCSVARYLVYTMSRKNASTFFSFLNFLFEAGNSSDTFTVTGAMEPPLSAAPIPLAEFCWTDSGMCHLQTAVLRSYL